ncbi:MAG TPA: inorganic phosphate transporter [Bryobacteraceae bacterium]|nr:inorganic phosphate transporter [Bryobacteraceae bacterium]
MEIFGEHLSIASAMFLLLALGLALSFEFVNGFHDTANAVATVIYTHTLKPTIAVVWSGCWNLIGVLNSTGGVAFGVLALLPVELVVHVGSAAGFAMVFALLISAIIWNLGTWYFGLPASSSHTLIGSIMGVGLANSMMSAGHVFGEGVNWAKASEVGMSLLISPIVGFTCAALLLLLSKALIKRKELYMAPDKEKAPPLWIRLLLIFTCTGVSFAHGSNDGQKGMGLIMLILIGILPATYAVDLGTSQVSVQEISQSAMTISSRMDQHAPGIALAGLQTSSDELSSYLKTTGVASDLTFAAIGNKCREISAMLEGKTSLTQLNPEDRRLLRTDLYLVSESLGKLLKQKKLSETPDIDAAAALHSRMDKVTKFIPLWVKVMVAIALGLGTMIGWKRIVVTVGEKIGKEHLTYAQGASAELVAMGTILMADRMNLPVSTTHVLSSGIAGTMAANRSGLQMETLRNLLLAWVLTLPVSVLLGAGIFAFGLNVVLRLGLK